MGEETQLPVPRLASAQEGAEILGVSRQRFTQLAAKDEFPAPVATLAVGRIWRWQDLADYGEARPKRPGPQPVTPETP